MNKVILIVVVLILVVAGAYFLFRGGYQAPAPAPAEEITTPSEEEVIPSAEELSPPSTRKISVRGEEFSFSPSSLPLKAGEKVEVTFTNVGSIVHNFVVEGVGVATKTIGPGQTDTVEFTAPASGTYVLFCSVPGHRGKGMEGSLIVE